MNPSSSPQPTPTPNEGTPVSVTSRPATPPAPRPTESPAARRGGRFMDVVHPSSDMRSATTPTPAVSEIPPQVTEESSAPVSDWPDPIDQANQAPLESPFLTDAKIEKRPLGGFGEPAPAADLPVTTEEQPVELSDALTSIDSEDAAPVIAAEPEQKPEPTPSTTVTETIEANPVADTNGLSSSIQQQYTEQPSTTEQPSGAIFDTDSYHQALAHPPKKKSGFLTVLWIIGILVLGAGLGAVAYFYVLPML